MNMEIVELVVTLMVALAGSSGLWLYVTKKNETKDLRNQLLMGLAHDRIVYLGMKYIEKGYISQDEYENLNDYLYKPYQAMGGNGSAKRIMLEIDKLPMRKTNYVNKENGTK